MKQNMKESFIVYEHCMKQVWVYFMKLRVHETYLLFQEVNFCTVNIVLLIIIIITVFMINL